MVSASIKVYILGTTSFKLAVQDSFSDSFMEELNDFTFATFPSEFSSSQPPLSTQPPEIPNSQTLHDSTHQAPFFRSSPQLAVFDNISDNSYRAVSSSIYQGKA